MISSNLTFLKEGVYELEKGGGYEKPSSKGFVILKFGTVKTSFPQKLIENPYKLRDFQESLSSHTNYVQSLPSELEEDKLEVISMADNGSPMDGLRKLKFLPEVVIKFIKEMAIGQKVIFFEAEKQEMHVYVIKLLEHLQVDFQTPTEASLGKRLEFRVTMKSIKTALDQVWAFAHLVNANKSDEISGDKFVDDAHFEREEDELACYFLFELPMYFLGSFQIRLAFSQIFKTDSAVEIYAVWHMDSDIICVKPSSSQRPPQAPPNFNATPESLIVSVKKLIDKTMALTDKIVTEIKPEVATFENVVLPIARDNNISRLTRLIIQFHQEVSTNAELRKASRKAAMMLNDFSTELSMREDVFKLVEAAFQKDEKLEPESKRLLEETRKGYTRNGLGLPAGPVQDRFKEITKRLDQRITDFEENLNEENGGIWFTKEELEGVPNDVVEGLEKGAGDYEGKVKISFKDPDLIPTMKFTLNEYVRRTMFIGDENKCNSYVKIFREIVILRDEAARMHGYPDHASFQIEEKLAKTPKTVLDFLHDLRTQLAPLGAKETEYLKALKKQHLESHGLGASWDGNYYLWDHKFFNRLMVDNEYSIDEQKVAEYFSLDPTVKGMLRVFGELFGLVFVEVAGKDRDKLSETGKGIDIVWHKDIKLFSVWDDEREGGNFCGYLYLDLHPRTGKYVGGHTYPLQCGFLYPDGTRHYPATALICNFTKPTLTKPSLLKHNEIITLFHELGHGIHDLVARTIYSEFHGTSVVWDFVKAPSQMLENWCWTPSQLKSLSKHYETGEKIPNNLIDRLIKARHVNSALYNLRQLHTGIFDMEIYTPESHEEAKSIKFSELFNSSRKEISGLDGPEMLGMSNSWGNGYATFKHLIKGYNAGYYGYLYAEVFAADIFHTIFAKDPMNTEQGRRYRHVVLEKGGSQDAMKMLEELLGRKPSSEAFYRELGLKRKEESD